MGREILVAPLHRDEARAEPREALLRESQRLWIAVDPDDPHVGRGLEESPGVTAEAERRVHVDAAALRPERRDDLPEEDGDVNRAGIRHGASDEMSCEFVVVLIRDRGCAQALEMLRAVDELQVVGLAEDERVALERRDLAQ